MTGLLSGLTVLEVSLFSPDALGGHLADLGATVIKVEQPGGGGFRGPLFPQERVENRQWNRGKKSVVIDLKSVEGKAVLRRLAAKVDVVVDGLRRGAAERLGFGYADVVAVNPRVVYCTLNGMGASGPYADLPTHGLSFDCFAGLTPPVFADDGSPRLSGTTSGMTGVMAGPLYGALAVLAALYAVQRDGTAKYVEVAQVDAAIAWNFQKLTALANGERYVENQMRESVRYQYYETSDDQYVVFNALEDKFWKRFCDAVNRPDLFEPGRADPSENPSAVTTVRAELRDIFKSRTRSEWIQFFIETDIAGAPAFLGADLFDDPHVEARELVYEDVTGKRMLGTPIKSDVGSGPVPTPAPVVGQDTDEVLRVVAGYDSDDLARLRANGVI
jgi:crotonobetainyl-CoA:carnitine CoA-transferase CaiB-like acyl-CoA transferase